MTDTSGIERAIDAIKTKNYSAALALLVPLAEAGNLAAISNLATMYQCGLGVSANGEKAVELYLRVARENIRDECLSGVAYHNLATIYTTGASGVERDLDKAEEYENLAEALGFNG
jgi:TPR repeat protein